ncbi:hypothetical protein N7486_004763 [Penicillium sp. IBT 16267x]|nr:hypothetical protein N7486_004763 [Penicillium sp. IBT 16267x]
MGQDTIKAAIGSSVAEKTCWMSSRVLKVMLGIDLDAVFTNGTLMECSSQTKQACQNFFYRRDDVEQLQKSNL